MGKAIAIIAILLAAVIILDIYFEVNYPFVNYVKVESSKLVPGYEIRILQISDYHNFKQNNRVLKTVKSLEPDIIVITGDLIDQGTRNFDNVFNFIDEAMKINSKIYFVSGNHEWRNGNSAELLSGLAKRKVTVLNNRNKEFEIGEVKVNICGVDDVHTRRGDINKALKGIDKSLITILLSHSPNIVIKQKNIAADIILSGHTHGGQIRFPFIGAVIAPGQGLFPKYNKGIYTIDEKTTLYIDSGLGTSEIPVRFLNRSQVSLVTLGHK